MEYTKQILTTFKLIKDTALNEAFYIRSEDYRINFIKAINQTISFEVITQAQRCASKSLMTLSAAAALNEKVFIDCLKLAERGITTTRHQMWYTMQSEYASETLTNLLERQQANLSSEGFLQKFPDAVFKVPNLPKHAPPPDVPRQCTWPFDQPKLFFLK